MLSTRATAALFCAVVVLAGAMEEESGMTSLSEGLLAEESELGMGGMHDLGEGACHRRPHVGCAWPSGGRGAIEALRQGSGVVGGRWSAAECRCSILRLAPS